MGEVGYEGRSLVTDHFFWKSMMAPDVFQEQPGNSGGVQGGDCGYGMNPFRQVIHHHKGGIVPLGVWEFSDHVYRDHLPALVRDLVGDQLPHLLCQEGLCPVACIASCNEFSNIRSEEHTSELQSLRHLVCRLLLEKKKNEK